MLMWLWLCTSAFCFRREEAWRRMPIFLVVVLTVCLAIICVSVQTEVCVTHSSVASLGMPLGRECSPLLLHRTTPSEHVQTSGQPAAGRQPLSSAPGQTQEAERDISDKPRLKGKRGIRRMQSWIIFSANRVERYKYSQKESWEKRRTPRKIDEDQTWHVARGQFCWTQPF